VAVVATDDGAIVDAAELEAHVARTLARYKVPRVAVVVDHIFRSPAGKADRRWAESVAATALGLTH
jgi:acyl-CoA synthetase (AMP-forming)/AMP-acid ligase II